jgi:hypothetical protein
MTHHYGRRCLRICRPDEEGRGFCHRTAPHSVKGRVQQAVCDYKSKQEQERSGIGHPFETRLETQLVSHPSSARGLDDTLCCERT